MLKTLRLRVTKTLPTLGPTFDTSSNNASKEVVSAQDAQININGVQVSRTTNTVTDLIDGYEFKLNSTTSSAATVVASIDANLAYSKVKEFVDIYNSVNSTIDTLTNKGAEGTEKGIFS